MTATIVKQIQRRGFCGDQTLRDYLVLDTPRGQMMILRDEFPLNARDVGGQIELKYITLGGGWQWFPRGKIDA